MDIMGYGFLDIHLSVVQYVLPNVQYLSHTHTIGKDNKCKAPGKEGVSERKRERERERDSGSITQRSGVWEIHWTKTSLTQDKRISKTTAFLYLDFWVCGSNLRLTSSTVPYCEKYSFSFSMEGKTSQ